MNTTIECYDVSLLYVEDEPASRDQLSGLLHRMVRTMFTASNGASGLDLYMMRQPDIVLTDIRMPGMDGLEMVHRIRQVAPDSQIIVLTAYNDTEYLLQCIALGINHFIHKPVDLAKLYQAISQCNDYIQMKRHLQQQEDMILLLSQAMEQAPTLFVITALDGTIEYVNKMFCTATGYTREEAVGQTPRLLKSGRNAPEIYQNLWAALRAGKDWECELTNRRKNGQIYWESVKVSPLRDSRGVITKYLKVAQDITERKLYEENLHYLSTHDSLTGLYNRVYFDAEMKRLASSREFPVSIIVADIDGLKRVNDTYGHDSGDRLIITAAESLLSAFRGSDVVARIGGDEFAVLLPATDPETAQEAVDRISSSFEAKAARLSGGGISLGIATAATGAELAARLKLADERMYTHKYSKRNTPAH